LISLFKELNCSCARWNLALIPTSVAMYTPHMAWRSKTQKTPKGYEIPIPAKEEVFKVLRKAAEPTEKDKSETPSRPEKD
jgi:hypothetical protein